MTQGQYTGITKQRKQKDTTKHERHNGVGITLNKYQVAAV